MSLALRLAAIGLRVHCAQLRDFIGQFWTHPRVTVGVPGGVTSARLGDPEPTRSQVKRARRLARAEAVNREVGFRRISDMIRYCVMCGCPEAVIASNVKGLYQP